MPGRSHTRPDTQPALSFDELEKILLYFSTSIYGQNTEEDILWDLARNCIARLGFVDCVIYLVDPVRNVLVQKAALGPKNPKRHEILNAIEIPVGQGITGHVAQSGKPELIVDTTRDPRYIVDDEARHSELCVPILGEGRVLGLIDSEHPQKGFFTSQHVRVLTAIASICANKLLRVRAEKAQEEGRQLMNDLKARALRAQLSPHFVFNALNAIQHFITAEEKEKAVRFLSLFSKLIRYHLANYEKDEAVLEKEMDMLEWYLKLQQLRYEGRFEYRFDRRFGLDGNGWRIPSLVVSSLMEFAVEQSMFHQEGLSQLFLKVDRKEDKIELEVLYGPVHLDPKQQKEVNYREEFLPWERQVDLLNKIRGYGIETGTDMLEGEKPDTCRVRIRLLLPLIATASNS